MLKVIVLFLASLPGAWTQTIALDSPAKFRAVNVTAEAITYKGQKALRVVEAPGPPAITEDRLIVLTGTDFQDGVIEAELSGAIRPGSVEGARGFVGIAFRIAANASKFECFYLRPSNGRAGDQVRRNHSAQYISFPGFPWQRLRKEFPEKYETYVDLVPGEWTKVRIEVQGDKARLYVHGAQQPSLIVNDLKSGEAKGAIGLWIGPGTEAHFSNLRLSH